MAAALLVAAPLSGAAGETPPQDEESGFATTLMDAEALRTSAAAAGFEWLKTAELLRQAREQADAGDFEQAWALLQQGQMQAEMALEQAEREAQAWRRRVVK